MSDYTVLNPGDTIDRVGKVLLSGTERHFVVAREEAGVVGVLYNENITEAFQSQRNDLTVDDMMDKDFKTVNPDEDLSEIYRTVQGRRHNFFPVMDGGELIGTIDMENINEFMMIRAALDY